MAAIPPDDPRAILADPGAFLRARQRSETVRPLVLVPALLALAALFAVPAYLLHGLLADATSDSAGVMQVVHAVPYVAGGLSVLVLGLPIVGGLVRGRARRIADAELRAALAAGFAAEHEAVAAWARGAGLKAHERLPAALRDVPLLLPAQDEDVSNVAVGPLGGRDGAVFSLTQVLDDDEGRGPARRFRFLTCVHLALDVDVPPIAADPRDDGPRCPLDAVAGRGLGEAWRAGPPPPREGPGGVLGAGLAGLERLGHMPRGTLERVVSGGGDDPTQMLGDLLGGRRGGLVGKGLRSAIHALTTHDVETESAELDARYRVWTWSDDRTAVVRALSPATIVALLDGGDPLRLRLGSSGILVAAPGRLADAAALDALVARAGSIADRLVAALR